VQSKSGTLSSIRFRESGRSFALSRDHTYSFARLSMTALMKYKRSVKEESELVARLNVEEFQSRNWTVAHLRLAEMQVCWYFL
jgi:hypothetical protein